MELKQTKHPRKEEPMIRMCRKISSASGNMHDRSPYERKIGKIISICSKCEGEGKVRAPLSKKARARRKRKMQQSASSNSEEGNDPTNGNANQQPLMKPCRHCDGSGLIAITPSSKSNNETEQKMSNDFSNPLPRVKPGISVAIIGGGIGGIALAAALQHRGIPSFIYERDTSFEERKQGYGLTMQQGARALMSLGFFSLSDNDKNENESKDDYEEESDNAKSATASKTKFGIHSTRHIVHKPDGEIVGEWGMKVWGGRFEKNGRKHAKRQNAHISRQNLRKLLLESLKPGTIKWGYKFVSYSEGSSESISGDENPKLKLTFQRRISECQGMGEECDEDFTTDATIIVGCDGIRSAVRAQKLGQGVAPLRYLGCIVILGIVASPESYLTDGETVFQTADGVTRLYAMPFARPGDASSLDCNDDYAETCGKGLSMWQLSFPMEECDAKKLSQLGPGALKVEALKRCGLWHDPIPQLLSQTSEDLITGYPCYDRALVEPAIFREGCNDAADPITCNHFVTMLGDAAHPMSPFKGQGANQALLDAVLLARKLYSFLHINEKNSDDKPSMHQNDRISLAIKEFEEEMLQRSAIKVKKSADAAKFLHTHVAISEGNVTRGAAAVDDAAKVEANKHDDRGQI
eukprot:CAMPEP_0183737802 /NCGR_PEP_ID=MMETSP0737-20130205/52964_1 /TAXON_ID=385413 /ORGANISM="Thalassiosira miniscula, Strain CCMP1093" /LENGTH=635 /DNA_ID=CAMNT_0025972179 /DNA_START=763 /DNA_END=2670 /DNA_ORIENTATION=-